MVPSCVGGKKGLPAQHKTFEHVAKLPLNSERAKQIPRSIPSFITKIYTPHDTAENPGICPESRYITLHNYQNLA